MLDWGAFQALAADVSSETVTLTGDSLTLFFMLLELAEAANWRNAGALLTDSERDECEAMVAQAWADLEP